MPERVIWGIHMPADQGLKPIERKVVAIGWDAMGDLGRLPPAREAFKAAYARAYPEAKPGNVAVSAGVLFRFAVEMKQGDLVLYPSKSDRMVNYGVVAGSYRHSTLASREYPNELPVTWSKSVPRESFSQSALNEIGSALTLFRISSNADEFLAALNNEAFEPADIDEVSAERLSAQVEETTEDFIIKRLKSSQTPHQFEHFTAHLLTRMGYHARVTKASGDGGIDIIAHRDELGFEPPIIEVQCKQVLSTIGRPEVQQLHGAIEHGEHGLFVTLGGFSAEARTYKRGKPNLRLIDGQTLIESIYAHYEQFEPRYQMLLPLKRSYVPAAALSSTEV